MAKVFWFTASRAAWAATLATLIAPIGLAASPSAQQREAAYMAGTCANCHGTSGRSLGTTPSLAGQSKENVAEKLRQFRDGQRPATIMHQISKGYSDAQIDALADHYSRQSDAR